MIRACCLAVLVLAGGDADKAFADGVALLRSGRSREALQRLQEAEKAYEADPPPALLADLALAAWRCRELPKAEAYAERAAARDPGQVRLRDLVLGAARLVEADQARQTPDLAGLDEGLAKVGRAIRSFERALEQRDEAAVRVLLEQALRLEQELRRLREEKQREQEQDGKQDQRKDERKDEQNDEQKQDRPKQDGEGKPDGQRSDSTGQDPSGQDPSKPDPSEGDRHDPDLGDPGKSAPDRSDPEPRDQPGAGAGGQGGSGSKPVSKRELSPEQRRQLLQELERARRAMLLRRAQQIPQHQPGKKDW